MHRCQVKVNILPWTSFICISLKQGRSVNLDIIEFNDKDQLQHLWQDRDLSDKGEKASLLPKGAYKCWLGETVPLFQWTDACKFLNNIGCIWNTDPQFKKELSYSELWRIVQQNWLEYKIKELESNQCLHGKDALFGCKTESNSELRLILSASSTQIPTKLLNEHCEIFNLQSSPRSTSSSFQKEA